MNSEQSFSGTKAMATSHAFEVEALEAYLSEHLPGFRAPLRVEQFKGGQSNPTYLLHAQNQRYVMRTKPAPVAQLLPSAHAIEREYRVMQALHGTAVPVAKMHLLCQDESVIGRAFYVMEFVEGRVLWNQALPSMTGSQRSAHYDELNRVIAALHQVDPLAVGLSDYGKPGNYFERQIARWSKQYVASITTPIDAMDRLMEWLPANIPSPARGTDEVSIVHGDFRIDNVIFHPSEPRILAVLDWELSTLGHPLADFSYHCMSWHIPHHLGRGMGGLQPMPEGIPSEANYVARYAERTGRTDLEALRANWNFYLAYNLFRIAAILQGIAKRFVDGTASSAQARSAGEGAKPLADLAWDFARRHA